MGSKDALDRLMLTEMYVLTIVSSTFLRKRVQYIKKVRGVLKTP